MTTYFKPALYLHKVISIMAPSPFLSSSSKVFCVILVDVALSQAQGCYILAPDVETIKTLAGNISQRHPGLHSFFLTKEGGILGNDVLHILILSPHPIIMEAVRAHEISSTAIQWLVRNRQIELPGSAEDTSSETQPCSFRTVEQGVLALIVGTELFKQSVKDSASSDVLQAIIRTVGAWAKHTNLISKGSDYRRFPGLLVALPAIISDAQVLGNDLSLYADRNNLYWLADGIQQYFADIRILQRQEGENSPQYVV